MKNIIKSLLIIIVCFFLAGCEEEVEPVILDYDVLGTSKDISEKYNLDYENIDLEFDAVNGYANTIELYMKSAVTDETRKEDYIKLVDYFKTVTDDKKIYDESNNEYDLEKIDELSRGIFLIGMIKENKYKINIYQYQNKELNDKTYSTYEITFKKM